MTVEITVGADGVAQLLLNRPDHANTIDLATARELLQVANDLHSHGGVRAVVLTGAGRRFCAGGDLHSFDGVDGDLGHHLEELTSHLHAAIVRLHALDAPLVAGVHGVAAGAGFSLACGADLLVAGSETTFVLAYAGVGLTPDAGGSWFLPRLVGLGRALDLALTNRTISAHEAEAWGLVTRVVPEADVAAAALELARGLADGPVRALASAKRLLHASLGNSLAGQLADETRRLGAAARTAEGREGVAAFAQRRPPVFRTST